jgi:hypothetical protein
MTDPGGWEKQLSELMTIAAGEPRREVSLQMVRRRLIRRRLSVAAAGVAMAVVLGGIGAAAAAAVADHRAPASGAKAPGVPSFYVQYLFRHRLPDVRSRTTGAITGTVRCPWPASRVFLGPIAAAANRTFFLVCSEAPSRQAGGVLQSRIYRFRLTVAGRVRGYSLVKGGTLPGLVVSSIAATPDGSVIAVSAGSPRKTGPQRDSVIVIRTRTGARAVWRGSSGKPGTISYPVVDLSLTSSGREVVFLTDPRCVPRNGDRKCHVAGGEEVRAFRATARGGQVNRSRLLFKQAALMRIDVGYINAAVVSPDGSLVTVAEVSWPAQHVSIAQVSAATGKQVAVLYRLRTGNGFFYRTFSADPSARYFILAAGRSRGPIKNGWIDHGRLITLRPHDGSNVNWEVW